VRHPAFILVVESSMKPLYESVGALHLHSDFSDGALSITEIARIAEEADLDFLMFTDHNTLKPNKAALRNGTVVPSC